MPGLWVSQKFLMVLRPRLVLSIDYYTSMISNGFMIARPQNQILKEAHMMQHEILHKHSQSIRENPAPEPRCCQGYSNGYPLRWAELMGENMAFVAGKYIGHLRRVMAMPDLSNYV